MNFKEPGFQVSNYSSNKKKLMCTLLLAQDLI